MSPMERLAVLEQAARELTDVSRHENGYVRAMATFDVLSGVNGNGGLIVKPIGNLWQAERDGGAIVAPTIREAVRVLIDAQTERPTPTPAE